MGSKAEAQFVRGNVWQGDRSPHRKGWLRLVDARGGELDVPSGWCHYWDGGTEVYPECWPALRLLEQARDHGLSGVALDAAIDKAVLMGNEANPPERSDHEWDRTYDMRRKSRKAGYRGWNNLTAEEQRRIRSLERQKWGRY